MTGGLGETGVVVDSTGTAGGPAATVSSADPDRSRTERLIEGVRRTPLFRQLVPMEAGIGWPIPVRKHASQAAPLVCLRLPLFGMCPAPGRGRTTVALFPPFATVTLECRTGRAMEYVDLRFTQPWPATDPKTPAGYFPHDAAPTDRTTYLARRRRLLELYDVVVQRLAERQDLDDTLLGEFRPLLRQLVEPPLEPYYRALGLSFYRTMLGDGPVAGYERDTGRDR